MSKDKSLIGAAKPVETTIETGSMEDIVAPEVEEIVEAATLHEDWFAPTEEEKAAMLTETDSNVDALFPDKKSKTQQSSDYTTWFTSLNDRQKKNVYIYGGVFALALFGTAISLFSTIFTLICVIMACLIGFTTYAISKRNVWYSDVSDVGKKAIEVIRLERGEQGGELPAIIRNSFYGATGFVCLAAGWFFSLTLLAIMWACVVYVNAEIKKEEIKEQV